MFKEGKRKKNGKYTEADEDNERAYMKEKEGEGENREGKEIQRVRRI